ncbi:DnaD domain protein [Clostridium beijerinckii]|jgi:DNA replication protein DnaD|uniref:DnaD domain protein n=2 Tax=Clostridium beijerinckii TaxID=1520 RepID=A0AAE2RQA2_CLOBE|nr:DnaD domain protein [Clostridium beijerinckii]ABR37174.1 primosome, DnaD subunit [Clostridium beijerinckii NCIMB 8052]AIU04529.1 primosome, DnaD subunit [Clostridium beijerinckii ATCC 35702]MBF7808171.1 DnaD domain protein [Clostridium beijerinckii]NOW88770.1 DnaD/phage-associated family protein [Clostridium beijerinckii]NRT21735.1 DnaD/phage-associated family protein [Clostridium beijerinckii]
MSTFMLKNRSLGFTPVNNVFIEKYMPQARGEFVKVYLLMLKYTISGELGVSSSILASSLNLLESDIMNAFNYWNDQGAIKLTQIDKMGNFNVEFVDLVEEPSKSTKQVDLLEALDSTNTKDMLKDIETLLARPLSPNEMSLYLNWQKEFGFSSELILILMEYCISKGKSDSRYIEKVAIAWHDQKITTIEQAQNLIKKAEDKWINIRKILTYLGINNTDIMKPQQDLIEKWLLIYKYSNEIIFKACDVCFERLNRADFKYIDGILSNWNKNNIRTLEDIALKDNKNSKNNKYQKTYNTNNNDKSSLKFNNFEAREYDYDSLEKKLLGWDSDD